MLLYCLILYIFQKKISANSSESYEKNYQSENASSQSASTSSEASAVPSKKSQRYLELDEQENNLKISKSMQDFVYKKMSKTIENSVEFVDVPTKKSKTKEGKAIVKLLKDTEPIKHYKFDVFESVIINQIKPVIKIRVIEKNALTEDDKIQMACVNGDDILSRKEVQNWKEKKPKSHKIFSYKEKNNVLYLIEPENEFSKLKKKNNWSESKITGFKKQKIK